MIHRTAKQLNPLNFVPSFNKILLTITIGFGCIQFLFLNHIHNTGKEVVGGNVQQLTRETGAATTSFLPSPESLTTVQFCAEKCRYIAQMCQGLYRDTLSLPAPSCLNYSTTVEEDIYWNDHIKNGGHGIFDERNKQTVKLVHWAAAQARERRGKEQPVLLKPGKTPCEDIFTSYTSPMMFPEEFEFIVKLMTNARPKTYLEWGCGTSTSFYPLLASGEVIAIDGYPPWCKQVGEEPRVSCMGDGGEQRLHLYCPALLGADGITKLPLLKVGKIPKSTPTEDIEAGMNIYVSDALDQAMTERNVSSFDVALVDGRFRVQCALKLLPFLNEDSVLLMHDLWVRYETYRAIFDYYYVIGYARSVVAFKKKPGLSKEDETNVYKKYMTREHLKWTDVA